MQSTRISTTPLLITSRGSSAKLMLSSGVWLASSRPSSTNSGHRNGIPQRHDWSEHWREAKGSLILSRVVRDPHSYPTRERDAYSLIRGVLSRNPGKGRLAKFDPVTSSRGSGALGERQVHSRRSPYRSRHRSWGQPPNGFRIDHVFGNEAFTARFPAYWCNDAPQRAELKRSQRRRSWSRLRWLGVQKMGMAGRIAGDPLWVVSADKDQRLSGAKRIDCKDCAVLFGCKTHRNCRRVPGDATANADRDSPRNCGYVDPAMFQSQQWNRQSR